MSLLSAPTAPIDPCPTDEVLSAYVERALDEPARDQVTEHLGGCDDCRSLLINLAGADSAPKGGLGRYVILSALGAGGMGIVYAAYDRELGRKVALKFLRPGPVGQSDSGPARERLLREAQALAMLAHPNVITVHDVGVLDGEVFVAMEFVEGKTLRAWLTDERLKPAAILAVLQQAGEGLVAAHAAGLVHRDFKPDNVLVGDDGRVRVTDFGLARADVDETARVPDGEEPTAIQATLTRTGALLGTPAYMAPEQRLGERADARADVYAFAVTLHEALTGARPGEASKTKRRMPARLERLVARGLLEDPAARWPSMRAFLVALARTPLVSGARVVTAVVVLVLGLAAAFGLRRPPLLCPPPVHAFDGMWDEARRGEVERAFVATHRESSSTALARVIRTLDAYRDAWTTTEVDTCQATRIRGEQSERLLDLRMACLDERRHALASAAAVLASADVDVVGRAVEIVDGLPAIAGCANARSLEQILPLPEDAKKRAAIQSASAGLDTASALLNAGKAARARAIAEPLITEAESLGYPPLLARALYLRGAALYDEYAATEADKETTFVRAAASAVEGRDDASAAAAFLFLIRASSRPDASRAWAELADASIRRLGGDDFLEGERLLEVGRLEIGADHPALARTLLLRARPLIEKTRGPEFSLVASIDQNLGNAATDEDNIEEAMRYHQRALDLRRKLYGRDHPATISSMFNTAEDFIARKRPDDALPILHEIGDILGDRSSGERGWLSLKLGVIARMKGDPRAALVEFQKALQIFEGITDKESRLIANIEAKIGDTLLALDRPAEAIAPLTRTIAIYGKTGGDEGAGDYLANLARATWDGGGDRAEAIALMRRALASFEKKPGGAESAARAREWLKVHGDKPPRAEIGNHLRGEPPP